MLVVKVRTRGERIMGTASSRRVFFFRFCLSWWLQGASQWKLQHWSETSSTILRMELLVFRMSCLSYFQKPLTLEEQNE
jgi:hypothetical protein